MKNILFYISGHGFGHSTRMIEVMNKLFSLDSQVSIYIRTSAAKGLFERNLPFRFYYSYFVGDVGIVQKDRLTLNELETLEKYADLIVGNKKDLLSQELNFVKRNGISLIVGDIPPLAFDIADKAGVCGIAISNFSWDWIYSPFVEAHLQYQYLLEAIKQDYAKADILLRLPFHGDMSAFRIVEDIPLIARKSGVSREEILHKLNVGEDEKRKVILLSFGGINPPRELFAKIKGCENYLFLSAAKLKKKSTNMIILHKWNSFSYHDLVKASDLVITKLGYGIVSECIANRTPIMYTSTDSREYSVLLPAIKEYAHSYFIPREDLLSGNWKAHLDKFFDTKYHWPTININGAEIAARKILEKM